MEDARNDKFLNTNVGKDTSSGIAGGQRSDVTADNPVPSAPFFGVRTLTDIPLDDKLFDPQYWTTAHWR